MYVSEAMITACEDMQKNANEMESQIKDMMEMEGRNHGIELDKRKSARDLNIHMKAEIWNIIIMMMEPCMIMKVAIHPTLMKKLRSKNGLQM